MLKNELPNGNQLSLAVNMNECPSAGTAKTIINYISQGKPLMAIAQGNPTPVKIFYKKRSISFSSGTKQGAFVPSGSIISIHHA
jgi:hypothetical protein